MAKEIFSGPKSNSQNPKDSIIERSKKMKFATKTIHAAQPSEPETGSLIAPIFQTSTYEQESPGQD